MFVTPLNKISIMFFGHVIKNKYGIDYHVHLSIASNSLGEDLNTRESESQGYLFTMQISEFYQANRIRVSGVGGAGEDPVYLHFKQIP